VGGGLPFGKQATCLNRNLNVLHLIAPFYLVRYENLVSHDFFKSLLLRESSIPHQTEDAVVVFMLTRVKTKISVHLSVLTPRSYIPAAKSGLQKLIWIY